MCHLVLKEKPNMGFCEVAPLLARLWKELPDGEKKSFDQLAYQHKKEK